MHSLASQSFFAVMYHYVRPRNESKLRYFSKSDFEDQLDYFQSKFGFVTREDWIEFRLKGKIPRGALLTFDDGLRDHFVTVMPELTRRDIFALFFVNTNPLLGKPLSVHLVHWLLANVSIDDIFASLIPRLKSLEISTRLNKQLNRIYEFQDYNTDEKRLKRLINWALKPQQSSEIVEELFCKFSDVGISEFVTNWYLNENEIRQLSQYGFEIGSHTCSHSLLSNLDNNQCEYEILESRQILSEVLNSPVNSFCFPFGGPKSYRSNSISTLAKSGYAEAFSVGPSTITSETKLSNQFSLPRFDCIELPKSIHDADAN